MTEPVEGISRGKAVAGKNRPDTGSLRREKHPEHHDRIDDDSIEISDEARERASGKKQRNILEYIKDAGS